MTESAGEIKELFLDALELAGSERERFLAELRRRTPEAEARVRALLAAHEGDGASSLESLGGSMQSILASGVGEAGSIVGDYELIEEIASGASGVVWRARQRSLDREVALKVLRAGRLAGRREVDRFRAEAEVVGRFHRPDIVPIYEVGEHEGRHFFSMRYFAGGSLADRIDESRPWEPRLAADLVRTIARAVHHAHQRGLLHRDLKPSNVLLDEHGAPAVADFGVAAHIDEAGVAAVTATLAGTPTYMAPEQTVPGSAEHGELTVATDVWALGCILYELVSGRPPFQAETLAEILSKVRDEPPFPLRALAPEVPRDIETIILRCLAKEPSRRYASANALAIDLGRFLEHEPILARRTGPLERLALLWRRNPVVSSLGLVVGILLVALAIGASWASVQLSSRLRDSYLGEARAVRFSSGHGRRARALKLLAQASRIRPGPDLRDEAIACLALTDLAPEVTLDYGIDGVTYSTVDADLSVMAHAPDGERIIARRLPTGEALWSLTPEASVANMQLSPGGDLLAVTHRVPEQPTGFELRVYDMAGGEEVHRSSPSWGYGALAFSPDSRFMAVGHTSGRVRVHDLVTNELVYELERPQFVGALLFGGSGEVLYVGSGGFQDGTLSAHLHPSGATIHETPLPRRPLDLAWIETDREVWVGCNDFDAYAVRIGSDEPHQTMRGHRSEVVAVDAAPGSQLVYTTGWDGRMRVWNLDTGEQLVEVPAYLLGVSRDGSRVAYRTVRSIVIARVIHGEILRTFYGHTGKSPVAVAIDRAGERVASFGTDQAILWDIESGQALGQLAPTKTDGVEFAPDGESLYVSWSGGFERRDAARPFEPGEVLLAGDQDHCDLSFDGRRMAVRDEGTLQLFDPANPSDVRSYPGYRGFEFVTVSGRGTYVAGMTWAGTGTSVWRASDGAVLARLREDSGRIATAFSPDESRLVLSDGFEYEVYSMPDLVRRRVISRDIEIREQPGTLAYAEDGSLLAVGMSSDAVALLDGETFEWIARLEARHVTQNGRPAFSADGSLLAIPSPSNHVSVWNLALLWDELEAAGIEWR